MSTGDPSREAIVHIDSNGDGQPESYALPPAIHFGPEGAIERQNYLLPSTTNYGSAYTNELQTTSFSSPANYGSENGRGSPTYSITPPVNYDPKNADVSRTNSFSQPANIGSKGVDETVTYSSPAFGHAEPEDIKESENYSLPPHANHGFETAGEVMSFHYPHPHHSVTGAHKRVRWDTKGYQVKFLEGLVHKHLFRYGVHNLQLSRAPGQSHRPTQYPMGGCLASMNTIMMTTFMILRNQCEAHSSQLAQ